MLERGELPATSRILKIVGNVEPEDQLSAQDLAALILKDFGLTKKVLRLANSCFYNPNGIEIATVSKAIIFLGFNVIKKIALATNYLEEILRKTSSKNRALVLSLLSRSFFAAFMLARLDRALHLSQEELFISALFYRLVRVLLALHLPEEYLTLVQLERRDPVKAREALYLIGERLGKAWSFPSSLVDILEGSPKEKEEKHLAALVADFDHAVQAVLERNDHEPLKKFCKDHAVDPQMVASLVEGAYQAVKDLHRPFAKYLKFCEGGEERGEEPAFQHEEFFQKALAEITALLASPGQKYQEVLFMVLETICRAFECESVLFGLFKVKEGALSIRYAVGQRNGALKDKVLPVGEVLKEIFRKKTEWAGKKSTIPEFDKIDLPEADILFSPLIVWERPLGMIMALRKRPFSSEESQKVAILRNLAVMSIVQTQRAK